MYLIQVGTRCLVKINDDGSQLLHGYIQEMKHSNGPFIVYLEELAECRTIPYDRIRAIATEKSKSWSLPCNSRHVSECHRTKEKGNVFIVILYLSPRKP